MASCIESPIKIFVYGDSHTSSNHFFPVVFREKVSQSSKLRVNFDIDNVKIFTLPGKSINDQRFLEQLNSNLEACKTRSVHVFAVGGNSIRDNLNQSKEQVIETMRCQFLPLIRRIENNLQAQLVICSLIPSPPHEPRCIEYFELANRMLKHLGNEGLRIHYLDFWLTKKNSPGASRVELFAERGRAKDVHLARPGVEHVCSRIVICLEHLNLKLFNKTQ